MVAREWGVIASGHSTSFRSNKNVQKMDSVSNIYAIYAQYIVCGYTKKNTGLNTLNR